MRARLIFVESNTTGSGMLALGTAHRMGLRPVLLTGAPQRYAGLGGAPADVVLCDTNSPDALAWTVAALGEVAGVTTTSEYFLPAVAGLVTRLGLRGNPPDAVTRCRDKARTRTALAAAGVGQPRFAVVRDPSEAAAAVAVTGLPSVVKPVDESGSQDVLLCGSVSEVRAHLGRVLARRVNARGQRTSGTALVEEYLDAPEYSVETFAVDGRTGIVGITAKQVGGSPYFVETGHCFPAVLPPGTARRVVSEVTRALAVLGLRHGPAHTEVRVLPDRVAVIEVNARLAGGMIPELVRLAGGADLLEQQIRAAVGLPVEQLRDPTRFAAIGFVTAAAPGTVTAVVGAAEAGALPGVVRVTVTAEPGRPVVPARNAHERLGHVIAVAPNASEVRAAVRKALGLIQVRTG
ncbi:ATP-grasp domain-containing protein [Saccharothrix sp. Mg75]|uniref:ATP-grasp domain-containing protein n=1 Tax=Saccharothrix sp. Mg75 TaxID=3445357 RepID=UPI003EECDB71